MGVAGAIVAGAGISAAAGLAGGVMQSGAAAKGTAAARAQFEQQRNDLGPYREAGLGSIQAQQDLLGLNGQPAADAAMANYQQSPGYQWQLGQGLRAVDAGAAAKGMLRSGATLKAEQEFGAGLANTDFGNYYARLHGLSTLGQSSAAGAPVAQAASVETGGANAQSSIYGNTASSLGGTANMLLNNTAVQNWLGGGSAVDTAIGRANGLAPAYTASSTYSAPIGVAPGLGAMLMSGAQTSSFYPVNQLLVDNAQQIANQYAPQRNELFVQRARQEIGGTEIEYAARAAQGLLGLGDEAAMAAAYPGAVAEAQRYGFLKNAPSVFPGKARLAQIAAMGTSSEKQAELTSNAATMRALTSPAPSPTTGTVVPPTTDGTAPAPTPAASGVLPPTPQLAPVVAPGGAKFSVAAPHAERFQALVNDLEAAGYKINPDQSGGYNRRFIAGTQTPSNHASGAAIDINWTANARGSAGDIPAELARSLAAKHGLVWGGDWTGASRDPMHFEIAGRQQPAAAPGGGRVQVASATPTVATDGTVVSPGAVAPVAVATPLPRAPATAPGLNTDQARELAIYAASHGAKPAEYLRMKEQFLSTNRADAAAARSEGQQAQSLQIQRAHLALSEDANRRANQELADKAKAAGDTFVPGTGIEAVHENTVQKYAAKVAKGQQLTDDEQRLYDGAYYALQQTGGQTGVMTDPNNAGQQIPFQTTRRLSPSLPEPKGGALPPVISQPGAPTRAAATEGQGKSAGWADRMQIAAPVMDKLDDVTTYAQRGLEKAGKYVGYNVNTPEYQQLRTAQEAFLGAILRKESGAAISPAEWERDAHLYFPMPGESVETAALKKRFRQAAMEGMIREAGPGYKPASAVIAPASAPAAAGGWTVKRID